MKRTGREVLRVRVTGPGGRGVELRGAGVGMRPRETTGPRDGDTRKGDVRRAFRRRLVGAIPPRQATAAGGGLSR